MGLLYLNSLLFMHCFMASLAMVAVKNLTTDQYALLAFKAHITFDPRNVLTYNWSISSPVCNWVGISCNARHGRVEALNISHMGLEGTIPPHLGNLTFLAYLNFNNNNFHGHLPNELGQLRRLKFICLRTNDISGRFPSWIGSLSKLQVLDLYGNRVTGTIEQSLFNVSKMEILESRNDGNLPSGQGKLLNLKQFLVGNNHLEGSIPVDLCRGLPALEVLDLSRNKITGKIPKSIQNCTSLKWLILRENFLTGEITQEIANLQKLENLNLGHNNLTGVVPPTIFNMSTIISIDLCENDFSGHLPSSMGDTLPSMEYIALWGNQFSGKIPNSISNASKLDCLDFGSNSFSGHIPFTFGNLRHLTWFNIALNNLTTESSTAEWSFLSSLTECRELTYVGLYSNPLYGILPSLIGNFSESLQYFYASGCKLRGRIPIEIGKLRSLIVLNLSNNELNGSFPKSVGRLRELQGLYLENVNLQGSIPMDLCQLRRLDTLVLTGNDLFGQIPSCLTNLTSLRYLKLGSNKFTSIIPSSLWTLEDILHINLSFNSLTGSLPSNIQNLKVLTSLDLSRNQLSGDIPVTLGGLKNLAFLSLAGNRFRGWIPDSFGNLISLESLDLSNNDLSGEIPKSLEGVSQLKHFNLSHNRLEGEIPIKGPFKSFSAQSFISNYALCGSPRLQVPPCKDGSNNPSKKTFTLVLKYVLPPIISTILLVSVIVVLIRRPSRIGKNPPQNDLFSLSTWRRTSYLEIQRATDEFSECNLLGRGSFGSVFRGILSDGTNVAVKVFNLQLERAFESFDFECQVLRNIRHRNLIKILSSCCNTDFKSLILEFMPNGSLEKWLYSHNYYLDILERLNIMIDVGLALEYLHHGHSTQVAHCDLKPSNILLDENMVAHVSDFGISKLLGEEDSITQTMTMATIGYMAPEYGLEGIVSSRVDVYSYGVVLMETFTRKKPTDEMFSGEMNLKNWVKKSLPHGLTEIVDANLLQEETGFAAKVDCLLSIVDLAMDCTMDSPEQRINMTDVVAKLKKIKMRFVNDGVEACN